MIGELPPWGSLSLRTITVFLLPILYIPIRLLYLQYFPPVPTSPCTPVDYTTYIKYKEEIKPRYPSLGPRGFYVVEGNEKGDGEGKCYVLEVGESEEQRERFAREHEEMWRVWEGEVGREGLWEGWMHWLGWR